MVHARGACIGPTSTSTSIDGGAMEPHQWDRNRECGVKIYNSYDWALIMEYIDVPDMYPAVGAAWVVLQSSDFDAECCLWKCCIRL